MADYKLIDIKTLLDFFSEDEDILKGFLEKFCSSYQELLGKIEHAVSSNDPAQLNAAAHEYKGTVANIFCQVVIEQAKALEQMGKSGTIASDAADQFSKLKVDSEHMVTEIKQYLDSDQ